RRLGDDHPPVALERVDVEAGVAQPLAVALLAPRDRPVQHPPVPAHGEAVERGLCHVDLARAAQQHRQVRALAPAEDLLEGLLHNADRIVSRVAGRRGRPGARPSATPSAAQGASWTWMLPCVRGMVPGGTGGGQFCGIEVSRMLRTWSTGWPL